MNERYTTYTTECIVCGKKVKSKSPLTKYCRTGCRPYNRTGEYDKPASLGMFVKNGIVTRNTKGEPLKDYSDIKNLIFRTNLTYA